MKLHAPKGSGTFWAGQRCPGCERFNWFTFGLKRVHGKGGLGYLNNKEVLCGCGWTYNLEK